MNHALALAFQPLPTAAPFQVRVQTDDDSTVWFCGSDVATALGYTNAPAALTKHCRPDGITKRYTVTPGRGEQELTFITEPNVYRLIVRSRRPEAEAFERWVFEDVLPMIRRTGRYAPEAQEPVDGASVRLKRAENAVAALTLRVGELESTLTRITRRLVGPASLTADEASRTVRRGAKVGKAGFYGVDEPRAGLYRARVLGKTVGFFPSALQAAHAYDAAVRLQGLHTRSKHPLALNYPDALPDMTGDGDGLDSTTDGATDTTALLSS